MTSYYGNPIEPSTHRLQNEHVVLDICTLGASVVRLLVPDRAGTLDNVVLGSPDWRAHLAGNAFLGDIVGPFANRIAGARFALHGRTYTFPANDRGNLLHSGPGGMHHWNWTVVAADDTSLQLHVRWDDPDGVYPGPITTTVSYTLAGRAVLLDIQAHAQVAAPLNIVSHPYFNLAGARPGSTIADHTLRVAAASYLPTDPTGLPTVGAAPVEGTPFDLRTPTRLGDVVSDPHAQVAANHGFDHAFVRDGEGFADIAWLADPGSGRTLTIASDEPALQVYTAGGVDGSQVAHEGPITPFAAIALETEGYPDAPNHDDFPSTLVLPGMSFHRRTRWTFGTA